MQLFNKIFISLILFFIFLHFTFGGQQLYGTQIIKYNLYDTVTVKVTLQNMPPHTRSELLYLNGNLQQNYEFSQNLIDRYNGSVLYARLFNKSVMFVEKAVLQYELVNYNITQKHPCHSYCEIIINKWSKDDTKGSQVTKPADQITFPVHIEENSIETTTLSRINPTTKTTVLDYTLTTPSDNSGDSNSPEILPDNYIAIYVVAAVIGVVILFSVVYFIITRYKKSRNMRDQEAYSYVTQNQLVYTQVLVGPPKSELPKKNYTSYSRIIGVLKQK